MGRTRIPAVAAIALLALGLPAGCALAGGDGRAGYRVPQLHLQIDVTDDLRDLVHVMGDDGEGHPAAFFSSRSLTERGGPQCAAGQHGGVSPYPLGSITLSKERPEKVREEQRSNPEEGLGEFVKQVGDRYLYYRPPPGESCAPGNKDATRLQLRQTKALKAALRTAASDK